MARAGESSRPNPPLSRGTEFNAHGLVRRHYQEPMTTSAMFLATNAMGTPVTRSRLSNFHLARAIPKRGDCHRLALPSKNESNPL